MATVDHNVPTENQSTGLSAIEDPTSRLQIETLDQNCDSFNVTQFKMGDPRAGIVHVIGPEQGATLPGMTVVCGDSHTATHGAFGALAHGIGTSEVEHVLATQCLVAKKDEEYARYGDWPPWIWRYSERFDFSDYRPNALTGGTGCAIEFAGEDSVIIDGRTDDCMQHGN